MVLLLGNDVRLLCNGVRLLCNGFTVGQPGVYRR